MSLIEKFKTFVISKIVNMLFFTVYREPTHDVVVLEVRIGKHLLGSVEWTSYEILSMFEKEST